MESAIPSTWS